jgi:hypothetical protein
MNDITQSMSMYWYEQWYLEKVKQNLDLKEKRTLLDRILEQSLKEPIWEPGFHYKKEDFPELAPFVSEVQTKGKELTGTQLYAVAMMLGQEVIHQYDPTRKIPRGSEITFGKPMGPDLTEVRKHPVEGNNGEKEKGTDGSGKDPEKTKRT